VQLLSTPILWGLCINRIFRAFAGSLFALEGFAMRVHRQISSPLFACFLLCSLVLWLASAPLASAQLTDTGTIAGTVTDPSGAVVPGVAVTLTDTATNTSHKNVTNDAGRYTFANVTPGMYSMTFAKDGFATTTVGRQEVKVGMSATNNVSLQVGGAAVHVEVTATGNDLQTTDAAVGQTITGDALDSLPGLGRDVSTFVTLQPGVAPDGSVAGGNQDQNSFQLDGGNNSSDMDGTQNTYTASFAGDPTGGLVNNEVTGTAPGGSPGGGGPTGVMPTPADSIEEFRVATNNQTADFNSSAGAQVRLVTKRGTNQWHGTAYEYYLDNNWAANSFDNNFGGTPRPSYHYNRFGGSLGGRLPLKEFLGGKTFIFANYEGFRWPNSATTTRATPSADMRLGLLTDLTSGTTYNLNPYPVTSAEGVAYAANAGCAGFGTGATAGLCDPQSLGISPTVQTMWQAMPQGNVGTKCLGLSRCDGVNVLAFQANYPVIWKDDFGVARLDHDFGAKWHFYTTYRYYRQQRATGNQINITGGKPVSTAARPSEPWYLTLSLNTNISNNLTNDFHYSFLRNWWARSSLADPPQVAGLGGALEPEGESSTNVLAPLNLDTQDVRTRFWDGKDHMVRDDVSWLKGTHFFTFGGLYQHNWNYHQRTDNGGGINYQPVYWLGAGVGTTNGMDMSGYLPTETTGNVSSKWIRDYGIILGVPAVDQIAYTRTGAALNLNPPNTPASDKSSIPFYNLYLNDSWRMKPSLTVSYGLGWALEMPPKEEQGKQIAFVDNNDKIIDTAGYLKSRESAALAGRVFNPNVGFALIGNVAGHPSNFYNPFYKSFSPRIAVAWNPKFDEGVMASIFGRNQTVVRGGYGILYGRLNGVGLVLLPLLGTGLIQAVQCISPLNDGVTCAGSGGSTLANSFRIGPKAQGFGGLVAPLPAGSPTLPQPDFVGINAIAAGAGSATDPHLRPSMNQQYDLTIQRQLNNKMSFEIGYIGRHITHEFQPININAVPYMMTVGGQRFDKAYGQMVLQYCGGNAGMAGGNCLGNVGAVTAQPFFETALAGTGYCTVAGAANCTQAVAINEGNKGTGNIGLANVWNIWSNLDGGLSGVNNGARGFNFSRSMLNTPLQFNSSGVPLPCTANYLGCSGQLTSGVGENTSLGYGNYNALFFSYKMSPWHGLTLQSNFTWSKALGTGSQVQATSQYSANDPFDLGRSYGSQPWDRKFMFNVWFTYAPPMFQGQNGVLGRVFGGWTFAPILDMGSGLPVGVYTAQWPSSAYTGGQSFGGMDGANISDYENAVNICGNRSFTTTRHNHFSPGSQNFGSNAPANMFQNPESVYNCFREPILGVDNGTNGGVGNLRGMPFWNVDFNIKKNVMITERFGAEFGATFTNVFNHNQLADPGQTYLSDPADFGSLETGGGVFEVNNPRKIEIAVRLKF
jgi:Carboxypeptidase regulatory-like domain